MRIEEWPLSRIVPYARNPRRNDGIPVAKVKASLKEYGWRQPIVVDAEGVIIVGHTRYKAAMELGWATAPVHVAEGLTAAQVKAYRIADNKTGEFAEWDISALELEIGDINLSGGDLSLTGFDGEEVDRMLGLTARLKEHSEDIRPIKKTRILLSFDSSQNPEHLEDAVKWILARGGEVDYGGN